MLKHRVHCSDRCLTIPKYFLFCCKGSSPKHVSIITIDSLVQHVDLSRNLQCYSVLFHRIACSSTDTKAASRCRCGDGCEIVLKPWSSAGTTTLYVSVCPSLPVSGFNVETDLFHCIQFSKIQINSALTWVNSMSGCWNSTSRSLSAPVNLLSLRTGTRSPDRL